jgi:hypothetical protein
MRTTSGDHWLLLLRRVRDWTLACLFHLFVQATYDKYVKCLRTYVEFPTNSTEKKGTTFWEAVLLPKIRTSLQEIQIRQTDTQTDTHTDTLKLSGTGP